MHKSVGIRCHHWEILHMDVKGEGGRDFLVLLGTQTLITVQHWWFLEEYVKFENRWESFSLLNVVCLWSVLFCWDFFGGFWFHPLYREHSFHFVLQWVLNLCYIGGEVLLGCFRDCFQRWLGFLRAEIIEFFSKMVSLFVLLLMTIFK